MGVVGAWDAIEPTQVLPLRSWCREFVEQNQRLPSIAVDISNHIYQVSTEKKSRHEGIEHMQLARRLLAFLALGCTLVCVFDGPIVMEKRRHAESGRAQFLRQASPMVTFAKRLARALRIPVLDSKAEAEAQCAALQLYNKVDVVFTSDADVLANGATRVLRYDASSATTGQSASTRVVKYYEVDANLAPVFAMQAMLLGNDWAEGVRGIGKKIAHDISQSKTGFAQRLADISASGRNDVLAAWRDDLSNELKTNKHKWLSRKCNSQFPPTFPDLEVYSMLLRPEVHGASACESQLSRTSHADHHDYTSMISALRQLWFQPSPIFGGNNKVLQVDYKYDAKQLASFQTAVAPMIVTSLLASDAPQLREFVFKLVDNSSSAEVVHSPAWVTLPEVSDEVPFFVGARVPRYLVDDKSNVHFLQKKAPKALRNNSTLDGFLKLSDDPVCVQPLKAVHSQSSPATFLPVKSHAQRAPSVRTLSAKDKMPATDTRHRHPLGALDSMQSNNLGTSVPSSSAKVAKRYRSKMSADATDTRVETYFAPTALRRSRIYPHGSQKVETTKAKDLANPGPPPLQKPQRQVIDLTVSMPVTMSFVSEDEQGDSDTDADDEDDDNTFCIQHVNTVGTL